MKEPSPGGPHNLMGDMSATVVLVRTQMTQVVDQVITWDSHTHKDFSFLLRVQVLAAEGRTHGALGVGKTPWGGSAGMMCLSWTPRVDGCWPGWECREDQQGVSSLGSAGVRGESERASPGP